MLRRNETHIKMYLKDLGRRPVGELEYIRGQMSVGNVRHLTRKGTPSHRKTVIIGVLEVLKEKHAWDVSNTDNQPPTEPAKQNSTEAALDEMVQQWNRDPDLYELIALSDQLHHAWVMGDRLDRWFFISVVVFLASVVCLAITTEHTQIWISTVAVFVFVTMFIAFLWLARLVPITTYPNTGELDYSYVGLNLIVDVLIALFGSFSTSTAWLWH